MTDNEIMTFEEAMFILRHGSAEGEHKYFEAVDVIEKEYNRQQEQIKKLENIERFATKTIEKQEAEIERLKDVNNLLTEAGQKWQKRYENAKSEAIKEFSERLNARIRKDIDEQGMFPLPYTKKAYDTVKIFIDNLVKEMTEQ